MTEVRYNNQAGVLGANLSSGGTTITFAIAPDFATLSAGQTITLVLDSGESTFEIVYLTAYTAGQLTGTITRQAEDSTNWPAVAHLSGTGTWKCGATVNDFTNAGLVTSVFGRTGAVVAATNDYTVGQVTNAQQGPLTGDVTTSGAAATLKNTGTAGTTGDATHVAQITTDAQGRVTGATAVAITAGGSGTVTSASVVSANGLAGTVASPTTTPAITLSTSVTGVLKGNGTAISAATAGTDYVTPTGSGAALTGITQSQVSGSQAGPLTGDVTTSGAAATLKNTGPGATGPIGSTSVVPVVTIDAQGRTTALTSATVTPAAIGALAVANNLSDVTTKGTGRENLRIPTLAAAQCAATANVNIASAPASVDGFSFVSSGLDTVLLTAQSTPSQNGPWVWNGAGSALTRPSDWSSGFVATTGRIVMVMNGTVNAGTFWYLVVASAGLTVDTTAQTWTSLNILGNAQNESVIRANSLDQLASAAGNYSMGSHRTTSQGAGILSTDSANVAQLVGGQYPFIVSGCVWTADAAGSTLNGSMTAGTVMINGILLTAAIQTAHAFTASKDTYVDFTDNGDGTALITYTAVANNATSPAMAGGTVLNTIRCATISTGASNIQNSGTPINQGAVNWATVTSLASTTVAAGSNTNPITTATLSVAANTLAAAGAAVVDTSAGTGAQFGSLITYTSGGGTTTLSGVVVLSGSGTVATGGAVTQVCANSVCDSLGNPIFPVTPRPGLIGFRTFTNAFTTTSTAGNPLTGLTAPFIIPAGPARRVKVSAHLCFLGSSAAAGSTLNSTIQTATLGGSFSTVATAASKVAVASDGIYFHPEGFVQLAAGSYVAECTAQQGAAGTLTVGTTYITCTVSVEMV